MSNSYNNDNMLSPLQMVARDPRNVSVLGPVERWELAVDERTPAEALRLLCLEDVEGQLSRELISNPNSPVDIPELIEIRTSSILKRLAMIKETRYEHIIHHFAKHTSPLVRRAAASNPNANSVTLSSVASDPNPMVRRSVARNPTTPVDIVISLSYDSDWSVVLGVAANRKTPPAILSRLAGNDNIAIVANDEVMEIRQAVRDVWEMEYVRLARSRTEEE